MGMGPVGGGAPRMLNPYDLLGLDVKTCTPADARRAYYALAQLAHPDKGGSASDMTMVHAAYAHVASQLKQAHTTRTCNALDVRAADAMRMPTWGEVVGEAGDAAPQEDGAIHRAVMAQLHAAFEAMPAPSEEEASSPGPGPSQGGAEPELTAILPRAYAPTPGYAAWMAPSEYARAGGAVEPPRYGHAAVAAPPTPLPRPVAAVVPQPRDRGDAWAIVRAAPWHGLGGGAERGRARLPQADYAAAHAAQDVVRPQEALDDADPLLERLLACRAERSAGAGSCQ